MQILMATLAVGDMVLYHRSNQRRRVVIQRQSYFSTIAFITFHSKADGRGAEGCNHIGLTQRPRFHLPVGVQRV